ncbi:alanine--tRNA ligase, partial [bacterium]|nr:alanine--tRNA ligase [bacterium]
IWNLVFQQYMKQDDGTLEPLPTQNIDTGAGLERLAAVLQGVDTDFEIDIFAPIVAQIVDITGHTPVPGTPDKLRIHRIADHVRGAVFCIGDGVLPGNKGRGYVLRRILRRASCDGHDMGVAEPFLYRLVPTVLDVMKNAYPQLLERADHFARIVRAEEESFVATLGRGSAILQDRIQHVLDAAGEALPGDVAAELWDTYGFPFEMTQQICAEQGLDVDAAAFQAAMDERQATSKADGKFGSVFDTSALAQVKDFAPATDFCGYDETEQKATILAIVADDTLVDEAPEGAAVTVVLDRTPFYGESGGQVGDTGSLETDDARIEIADTGRADGYFHHHGTVARGALRKGAAVTAVVDVDRRNAIRRNHTATHILQWALREVLGDHVGQAGSHVAPDRLRFDLTHFSALEPAELARVEQMVNARILQNAPVLVKQTTLDDARAQGATALFGEKYGDEVRMVRVGDFSLELCGGCHCARTGDIGLFKIVSETGIAAGVRRIEAVTGQGAYDRVVEQDALLHRVGDVLKAPQDRLVARAEELVAETKQLARDLDKAKRQSFAGADGGPFQEKAKVGDTVIIAGTLDSGNAGDLRIAADQLRAKHPSSVILIGCAAGGNSANLLCAVSQDVVAKGVKAGDIIKAAAKEIGGGGGGRPDMAQAGGKNPAGLQSALDLGVKMAEEGLK